MTLFTVVMLPFLMALGFWQLSRASEKRAYEDAYFDHLSALPQSAPADPASIPYFRVRLSGVYDAQRYFLVDNLVHDGEVGYQVISRLMTDDGRCWLLNRGWVPGGGSRDRLPQVATPGERVTVIGLLWPDTGLPLLLARDDWSLEWPKRVQRLNVVRMASEFEEFDECERVEVRLEAGQPGVFVAARQEMTVSPRKHLGYAVQWFGLAVALAVGFVVFGMRKHG